MMKKARMGFLLLAVLVFLSACGGEGNVEPATVPTTVPPVVDLGGTQVDSGVTVLDLADTPYDLEKLLAASEILSQVTSIDLGVTDLQAQALERLAAAYPNAQINYAISWLGQEIGMDTQTLDLSGMTPEQTDELLALLPMLPRLREISFVDENGVCAYSLEDIAQLDRVRTEYPELYLRVSFELFGQRVTSEDEQIEYYLVEIGNEGVETVRQVLPYLRSCTYFLMDGCGVDNEIMAQLREDFPEMKIVWRVWLVEEDYNSRLFLRCGSYLTDTHRIRTTYITDQNSDVLKYCTETKYVDVGHVWGLTRCDFLAYMPDLEVCILAITNISDITPLANHEKLEYLEIFSTQIADISPLLTCPNIEHLNLSYMPHLDDVSPVLTLTKLKRLRMVYCPLVSNEELQQIAEALPDCQMLNSGQFATAGYWRYLDSEFKVKAERYALLCEQMEYVKDAVEYGIH